MRASLSQNSDLAARLGTLEKEITARLNTHEKAIVEVLQHLMQILNPSDEPEPARRQIGFHTKDPVDQRLKLRSKSRA